VIAEIAEIAEIGRQNTWRPTATFGSVRGYRSRSFSALSLVPGVFH
jgi:hypothetical protein